MSTRSDEVDVLHKLWANINSVFADNLDLIAHSVGSEGFVPQRTVNNILSQHGGNISKAGEIMSVIKNTITIQSTPENTTRWFNKFVMLLHNLGLDTLAEYLVEELSKCTSRKSL